jgi:hypothetical protein
MLAFNIMHVDVVFLALVYLCIIEADDFIIL